MRWEKDQGAAKGRGGGSGEGVGVEQGWQQLVRAALRYCFGCTIGRRPQAAAAPADRPARQAAGALALVSLYANETRGGKDRERG